MNVNVKSMYKPEFTGVTEYEQEPVVVYVLGYEGF